MQLKPWGSHETLLEADNFKVKRLIIKPKARISLQYHNFRSEHWVIVKGEAKVTIGDDEIFGKPNMHFFIPKGVKHRIENVGKEDLVIIEVQFGEKVDENDIVRLQDDYGRT